jgi:large subunit ribosomal protein L25
LEHPLRELTVRVFPADIPEHFEVDVTALGIGKSIHVSELSIPKAEIMDEGNLAVAAVVAPRVEEVVAPAADAAATAEPEVIKKGKEEEGEAEAAPAAKKG